MLISTLLFSGIIWGSANITIKAKNKLKTSAILVPGLFCQGAPVFITPSVSFKDTAFCFTVLWSDEVLSELAIYTRSRRAQFYIFVAKKISIDYSAHLRFL